MAEKAEKLKLEKLAKKAEKAEKLKLEKLQLEVQAREECLAQARVRNMRAECRASSHSLTSSVRDDPPTSSVMMEYDDESNSSSTSENGAGDVFMDCVGGSANLPEGPVWEVGQRACITEKDLRVLLGTVSFVGEQTFAEGEWIGVVLDEPVGNCDGSMLGKVYFTCAEKHGVFMKSTALHVPQLTVASVVMEVESNVSPIVAELELVKNVEELNVDGSAVLPAGWLRVPSRSRPGGFSYQNEHTRVRQADVPTEPAISAVKSAENGVSGLDTVGIESMPPIAGLRAGLELVKTGEGVNAPHNTPLPDDEFGILLYESEDEQVVSGMGNQLEGANVLISGAEVAQSAKVNSTKGSVTAVPATAGTDEAVAVDTGLFQTAGMGMDIPDVCSDAEVILGWRKVTSRGDEGISAKQDLVEVLTTAMNEMGMLLATMKFARATSIGTHVMGGMQGVARGLLPVDSAPVLTACLVQGASSVVGHNEIDETKPHVLVKVEKMVRWSDSIGTVFTAAEDALDAAPTTTKDAPNTVSRAGVSASAAITVTITGASGIRAVSTQGQPDALAWKYGTVTAVDGWVEDNVCRDTIGDITDDHGTVYFFKRQNNAYSDLKEGDQVKFCFQHHPSMNGKQAINITREKPPAAPSAKKQAQSEVPVVVLAKAKPNSTANQSHKAAPAAKQGQNVKSVPPVQANVCGRLTFANAAAGKIELRTGDEQPRGALTAVVPSDIAAVEARMKTMEESMAAMVKLMQERLPSPDHSPPNPRRI